MPLPNKEAAVCVLVERVLVRLVVAEMVVESLAECTSPMFDAQQGMFKSDRDRSRQID